MSFKIFSGTYKNVQQNLLEHLNFEENLLEHECVNSKEAEASSSSDHEGCPRFVHVAPSAERHLGFGDAKKLF